jgi:FkbM family methyltransferase
VGITNLLRKTHKAAVCFLNPNFRKALKHKVAAAIEHRQILAQLKPDLVLDVGANIGQFALVARDAFPNTPIISFEPLPQAAEVLSKVMNGDRNFQLKNFALGETPSKQMINVTQKNDSSSLLGLSTKHQDLYGSKVANQIEIEVKKLDDALSTAELGKSTLLKIDTQGFELAVLKGAQKHFKNIKWIYAELSFQELYYGQPLASEVIVWLADNGYNLSGVYSTSYGPNNQAIQADMLFEKVVA